jgi:predicted metal-dependent HD superfamily phosphohydrolase
MNAQDRVEKCWDGLSAAAGCDPTAAASVLEALVQAYAEPHRHYHTLDHIAHLLALLDRHDSDPGDRDALALAILFHDAVYDPRRHDNEPASAHMASERLTGLGFAQGLVAKVERYILATRHDRPTGAADEADLALLLDLDLAVLAAAPADYRAYAQAVRREYAFVPEQVYRPGRRRVLEGFLARERIYSTERLHASWEAAARVNIATEIAGLA